MANPVLTDQRFTTDALAPTTTSTDSATMTHGGVVGALSFLFVLLVAAASLAWWHFSSLMPLSTIKTTIPREANTQILIAALAAFVVAIAMVMMPRGAKVLAPLYALAEGVVIGAISYVYNAQFPGIVVEAVGATLGVAFVMLFLYATKMIKVTSRMRSTILVATLGVCVFYLVSMLFSIFGGYNVLATGGALGIGISLLISGVAAFNLLIDFDFIDRQIAAGAPKSGEWYAAGGILITLVWLYLEMLRLIGIIRR